jgi:hypothetical protein
MLQLLREQAERSSPEVRAAALLRIARVEAKFGVAGALHTFESAIAEIRRLRPSRGKWLAAQARTVAAAIAPDRLEALSAEVEAVLYEPDRLIRVMLEYGHKAAAVSYTLHHDHGPDFPMQALAGIMHVVLDPDTRTAVLRRAVDAWRNGYLRHIAAGRNFIDLFQRHWAILPRAEALGNLHQIVEYARNEPEGYVSAKYDPEGKVTITSACQQTLFEVLHVLRVLDPDLAELLIAEYDQLAAAARRFPNGKQTIREEANANRPTEHGPGGYIFMGSPEDFPYLETLVEADRDGNFNPPLEYALEKYARDASSNYAPKELWPSAADCRNVGYRAARRLGPAANSVLDGIPDPDLRLFAAIELEAALARLPEFRSTTIVLPRPETDDETTGRAGGPHIRCPKCGWRPGPQDRWACKCGHIWNTFDTGGVCPACLYQWSVTACLRCGDWSPHSDWYAQE